MYFGNGKSKGCLKISILALDKHTDVGRFSINLTIDADLK
jgi:hypothetical protein